MYEKIWNPVIYSTALDLWESIFVLRSILPRVNPCHDSLSRMQNGGIFRRITNVSVEIPLSGSYWKLSYGTGSERRQEYTIKPILKPIWNELVNPNRVWIALSASSCVRMIQFFFYGKMLTNVLYSIVYFTNELWLYAFDFLFVTYRIHFEQCGRDKLIILIFLSRECSRISISFVTCEMLLEFIPFVGLKDVPDVCGVTDLH